MPGQRDEPAWYDLLDSLAEGSCIAFIGPGVSSESFPSPGEISRNLAESYQYPLSDSSNLAEVTQYAATRVGSRHLKKRLAENFFSAERHHLDHSTSSYSDLAGLPISIYITTAYDNLLIDALTEHGRKPVREICRWHPKIQPKFDSVISSDRNFTPSPSNPLVFYLYGNFDDPASLVLTEDDHLEFVWNFATRDDFFPRVIRDSLEYASLLFVGYSLRESGFRALLRGIKAVAHVKSRSRIFAQQYLPWTSTSEQRDHLQEYVDEYLRHMGVRVLWLNTSTFLKELVTLWKLFPAGEISRRSFPGQHSESGGEPPKIFLSYVREDEIRTRSLYQRLMDAGFKPWMDTHQIIPGERWRSVIGKAIRECSFFLVCLSNTAVSKRGYFQREFKEALDLWQERLEDDIYLIPVRFEDCEVPDTLRDFQWVDLFDDVGMERLIRAINIGIQRRED